MITPYMPTLNLSVDNALSLSQIVHQLITQSNNIVKYINDLNLGVEDKIAEEIKSYDERLQSQLEELEKMLSSAIADSVVNCRNYTNLKSDEIYSEIESLETELKTYVDKCNKIQDNEIKILKLAIESLSIELDKINKKSNSAVSPLTGESKSIEDCIYDCNQQSLKCSSYTIQQMLELVYSDTEMVNRINGSVVPLITSVDNFLGDYRKTPPKGFFGNNLVYLQQGSTTINSLITSSKGFMANSYKYAEDNNHGGVRHKILLTEIISDVTGLEDEVFQGTWLFFNPTSVINETFFKDENTRRDYLRKALEIGLLNDDYTIKTTGEYPL